MCVDHAMQKIWTLPHAGQQSYYGRGKAELGAFSAGLYGVRFDRLIICFPCSDRTADLLCRFLSQHPFFRVDLHAQLCC